MNLLRLEWLFGDVVNVWLGRSEAKQEEEKQQDEFDWGVDAAVFSILACGREAFCLAAQPHRTRAAKRIVLE